MTTKKQHGCRAKLAPGQWWNFCDETDMGQTMPALCEHCGGEHIRADDPDAKRKVEELNLKQLAFTEELRKKERLSGWILGVSDWVTTPVAAESYVGDGKPDCPAANEAISKAAAMTFILVYTFLFATILWPWSVFKYIKART